MASTSNTHLHQKSAVWHFFEPPVEECGKRQSKCRLCPDDKFLTVSNSGTTNLKKHIKNIHKINDLESASLNFAPQPGEYILREALVKWIATDCLPFTAVESESFHELVEVIRKLDGKITIPSARTVKRDLLEKYSLLKTSFKDLLANNLSKISLTTDLWTSNSCKAFLGVTAHWIDVNWQIQSRVLDLAPFEGPHTGINIANAFVRICEDF
ncbi:4531_t:CDS:1, partial [Ambispora leptoticha]